MGNACCWSEVNDVESVNELSQKETVTEAPLPFVVYDLDNREVVAGEEGTFEIMLTKSSQISIDDVVINICGPDEPVRFDIEKTTHRMRATFILDKTGAYEITFQIAGVIHGSKYSILVKPGPLDLQMTRVTFPSAILDTQNIYTILVEFYDSFNNGVNTESWEEVTLDAGIHSIEWSYTYLGNNGGEVSMYIRNEEMAATIEILVGGTRVGPVFSFAALSRGNRRKLDEILALQKGVFTCDALVPQQNENPLDQSGQTNRMRWSLIRSNSLSLVSPPASPSSLHSPTGSVHSQDQAFFPRTDSTPEMNRPRRQGSTVLRNEFSPSQASIGSCSRNEDVRKVEIEVTPGQILIKKKKLFVKGKMLDVYTLNETIIFSPASPAVTLLSPTEGDLTLSLHPSFLAPSFPLFFSVLLSFSSTFIFDKTDQIAMLDVTLEPVSRRDGSLLVVNRAFLFESSCSEAMNVKDAEGPLFVEFDGEEGLDAGGLEREWMELIADELMGKQKSGEGDKEKKEDEEMSRARTGRMETMREENQDDDDFSSEHDGEMDEDIDLHPEMDLDIPDLPQADSPTSPTINPLTTPPLSPQYLSPFGLAPLEPDPLQDTPDQPGNHSNQPQPFKDDSADNGCAFDDEEREAQARAVERRNKETFHITRRHRPTQPSRLAVSHSTLPSPMLSGRTSPQLTQSFVSTLFVASPNTDVYLINPQMEDNPSALMSYRFVGRVIAWALVDDVLFPMKFGWSVLKKLMNKALTMADVAHDDPDFYQERIRFLLDTDLSTLDPSLFNLTFSDDEMCRVNGEVTFRTFDLVKNGREIAVTEANKLDFVHLLCSHRLWNRVKRCLFAMRKGVRDVLGKRSLGFLTAGELSYFLSGEQEIEVEELVESIRVSGKKSKEENKKVLGWTALYLRSAKNDLLKNFVRFITGSSNVHPTGFKHYSPPISLYVNLHLPKDALPVAHTCFHQLDVPLYPCYQVFQNKLTTAIQEASSGFFLV